MSACPKCGNDTNISWPVLVDGKIVNGGCQECWEVESDDAWWDAVGGVRLEGKMNKVCTKR